jgi:hypothetical protein
VSAEPIPVSRKQLGKGGDYGKSTSRFDGTNRQNSRLTRKAGEWGNHVHSRD